MIPVSKPRRLEVFFWMISCSLFFILVYGRCQWAAAGRSSLSSWNWGWERKIPFVPEMIVPYWSLDLFFVASFFVCTEVRELRLLGKRILLAIGLAGISFSLLPLSTAFPRPTVSGFQGVLFHLLRSFDRPTNLFPSLHITLCAILAPIYGRHTRGLFRALLLGWFCLMGVSAVLTWQHQVIDVAGGCALAVLCSYLLRDEAPLRGGSGNPRVGVLYGAGAGAACAAAVVLGGAGIILFWPGLSLALVAAAYFGLDASIFRKESGRLPFSAYVILAPYLMGQALSVAYYRRKCNSRDAVEPNLLIGGWLPQGDAAALREGGVTAVLDLTAELSETPPFREARYCNIPLLDLTAPTSDQLRLAIAFIQSEGARGKVYVHCKAGYSRTAAVLGAYLLHTGRAEKVEQAIALLRKVRPSLVVRPEAHSALRKFAFEIAAGRAETKISPVGAPV